LAHMYETGQENVADTLELLRDELKGLLEKVVERQIAVGAKNGGDGNAEKMAAADVDVDADADTNNYAEFLED